MRAPIGTFTDVSPALERLDLLPEPVAAVLTAWHGEVPAEEVLLVDTDPEKADTAVFAETYGVGMDQSANCVVVAGKRGQDVTLAACVVLATTRADVNGFVRRHLGVRKASFAPMDTAVGESGMEYGGITPIGLPAAWPLLVDAAVTDTPYVIIGSGRRRGKLLLPGKALAALPGVQVVEGLGVPA
ncbi:YbaK/EbsC family protein [Streptomyces sp. NPDC088354]|uniref:YbaK/EbsC family protein n=1 Tax=unclassified Streptomyces TaxID=2593676 RepID=UPI0029A57072|nr:YbaK/EbsC family protein [Streptomyces sp. MI02-7b]MDX3073953.1 YbaK/EbsC family protein [Streptomyces sp. MI02-7b]